MSSHQDDMKIKMQVFTRDLRDRICAEFERIETELAGTKHQASPCGIFERKAWDRPDESGGDGGGGEMSVMRGRVFEKVGVNISTVFGTFSPDFQDKIPGAKDNNGGFWACGLSLVAHMLSPFVPAIHMNQRMIMTSKSWFGGGIDLNPVLPNDADTADFHAALKSTCDRHNPKYYTEYKDWCERYFFLPHRNEQRGVGGVFYDYL
ncbi:MAG: coproporphyrinogen III oxidase, partial [Pseudomonadota bacterium]